MKKSFYALEIFVEPGGARESLVFVFDNIADIKRSLAKCLSTSMDIYLMIWYGRDVNLLVYHEGKEVQKINLLPYIRIKVESYPEVWFDENGERQGGDFNTNEEGRIVLSDEFEELDFNSKVNWDAVPVQALRGKLINKEDKVTIFSNYMKAKQKVGYGLNETECGLHKVNIDWDDDSFGINQEDEIDWDDESWEVSEEEG